MNVCIIGGSGFVGTRLIDLSKDFFTISNFDKLRSHYYDEITTIGNILNPNEIELCLQRKDMIVLLAAEHRDDVSPTSLYYDVNVQGTKNVLEAMDKNGIKNIIFTSSVAIYGLNKENPNEDHPADPFNHYGKSKLQAEELLINWHQHSPKDRSLTIIRPTVIFGERNRGNVYNLLKQIASSRFLIVGTGQNKKSMAYVGNIVAFIKYCIEIQNPGFCIYNYIDKPDLSVKELVSQVEIELNKKLLSVKLPYWLGYLVGLSFDLLARVTGKKFSISAVRVKKFCATTQFEAIKAHNSGFTAPFTLQEGLNRTIQFEFVNTKVNGIVFNTE